MGKYQVTLNKPSADKSTFIKALRLAGRMNLAQATALALHLDRFRNSTLIAGVDKSVADHIASALTESGAKATVSAGTIDTPMICWPDAAKKYAWGSFRSIQESK
jgi:hypothetical protein